MPAPRKNPPKTATSNLSSVTGLKSMRAVSKASPAIANAAFIAKFFPITPSPKRRKGIFINTSITQSFAPVNCLINNAMPVAPPSIKLFGIKNPLRPNVADKIPKEMKRRSLKKSTTVILNS